MKHLGRRERIQADKRLFHKGLLTLLVLGMGVFLIGGFVSPGEAKVLYVKENGTGGGTSWENAYGETEFSSCGGVYNENGNSIVRNCTFSGNYANYSGGGMRNTSSNSTVTDCTFSNTNVTENHTIAASFTAKPTATPAPPNSTSASPATTPTPKPKPVEELQQTLRGENWISEEDLQDILSGKYDGEKLPLFSLAVKLDDATTALTLTLEITVVNDLPQGDTYHFYILGRTYDGKGKPTGLTILTEESGIGATLLHKQGKTETWEIQGQIFDGSDIDGNPKKGYISAEIGGVTVVVSAIPTSTPAPTSTSGGGCALGAMPPLLMLLLPLALLFRK